MDKLKDLKISTRLYIAFIFGLTLTIIIGVFALYQFSKVDLASQQIKNNYLPGTQLLAKLRNAVNRYKIREFRYVTAQDSFLRSELSVQLAEHIKLADETIIQYLPYADPGYEKENASKIRPALDHFIAVSQRATQLADANKKDEALEVANGESMAAFQALADLINVLQDYNNKKSTEFAQLGSDIYSSAKVFLLVLMLVCMVSSLAISILIVNSIVKPLQTITDGLEQLAEGDVEVKLDINTKDELGKLAVSSGKLIQHLKRSAAFSAHIGEGRFNEAFQAQSEKDVLAISLTTMRDKLKAVAEEDKRRNWATAGLAQFGEILRKDNDNAEVLYNNIISFVVKYMNVNQGGLFILNTDEENDETFLNLVACYAYNKKKYMEKKITVGEGLVGQCVLEKETIYMTEVPSDYVMITSGLGDATPNSVIIVPLKVNEQIFGVIELASFNELMPYEIEFLEKLAESLASTISGVQTNERTKKLLAQSQIMTEEMRSQDEEMRQNMEELQATQEEMKRISEYMKAQVDTINMLLTTTVFNADGTIQRANENFSNLLGYREDELAGKHHKTLLAKGDSETAEYKKFWQDLAAGKAIKGEFRMMAKNGDEVWLKGLYNPVFKDDGTMDRIIQVSLDITKEKLVPVR